MNFKCELEILEDINMSNSKIASILANVNPVSKAGKRLIFRASIHLKDGTKIYAREYGIRGFPIWI